MKKCPLFPPPFETDENEGKVLASQELHDLANEIIRLNLLEVKELVDQMGEHFGFGDDDDDSDYADMVVMGVVGGGCGGKDSI